MDYTISSLTFQVKGYSYMGDYSMFHLKATDDSGIRVMVTIPSGTVIVPWPLMNDAFQLIAEDWSIVGIKHHNDNELEDEEDIAKLYGGTE